MNRNACRSGRRACATRTQPEAKTLPQAIVAGREEFEEAHIAEDLELLADFVIDVAVLRVKFGEFV